MSVSLRAALAIVVLVLSSCYAPVRPPEILWANPIVSLAGIWPATLDAVTFDTSTSFDGNGSITIEALGDSSLLLYVVDVSTLEDRSLEQSVLTYQARVRTQGMTGPVRIEMRVRFPEQDTFQSLSEAPGLEGTQEWVKQETYFRVAADEAPDAVFLMLEIKGKGQVWLDDVRLVQTRLDR